MTATPGPVRHHHPDRRGYGLAGTAQLRRGAPDLPPDQDGLRDDWVSISYFLTKDADTVQVYLVDPAQPGIRVADCRKPQCGEDQAAGYHEYRYEGGVDLGAEPPNSTYTIIGEARDLAGNAVRVSSTLTIEGGGRAQSRHRPGRDRLGGDTNRAVSVPLGGKLCFSAVITNEGTVPLRTTGPWPGQEYTFGQNYNTLAAQGNEEWFQQAGVWRFGINFDTTGVDFPFRWAAAARGSGDAPDRRRGAVVSHARHLRPGQRLHHH